MTNQNKQRRERPVFAIPDVPEPEGTRCILVHVPDNLEHLAAFYGAVRTLTNWRNWALDPDHNATKCATLWRNLLEEFPITTFGECEMPTPIFQQAGDCTLQVSYDEGATWEDIFNAQVCADQAGDAAVDRAIESGKIPPIGQPGPDGGIDPDECRTFRVQLFANSRWLCPIPVSTGFRVTTSEAAGGWWDGDIAELWNCPSGQDYLLGLCNGGEQLVGTDPAPSLYHMRLIAEVDGVFYDAYNTDFVVPSGVTDEALYLQANDSGITDNQGSIWVTIEVCGDDVAHLSHNGAYPVAGTLSQVDIAIGDSFDWTPNYQGSCNCFNDGFVVNIPVELEITAITGWTTEGGLCYQWDSDSAVCGVVPAVGLLKNGTQGFGGNSRTQPTVTFRRNA